MHGHRNIFLAVACALCVLTIGALAAAEAPEVAGLVEQLRPPEPRRPAATQVISAPRARPSAEDPVSDTAVAAIPQGERSATLALPFQSGSAALTAEAERMLEALGKALNSSDLSRYRFRIEGHTDTSGEAPVNMALSERRAAAVRDHLVNRLGVTAARLDAVGLGETKLLVETPDGIAEPRNRRVQVVNIGG